MAKKKSKAAQEREGRAEATRYLRRPRMEDASAPSSPVRMQGSAPGEVSELTMDEIRSLNSQGADFASRYGPAVEAYGNMQSMGAGLAGAKAGIGPATKPKASEALPPRPEPPHPSTSPPRREVPSYKPTLGQAPPEPPPALPSGRGAPKVSRIPRLTENEVRAEWGEPPVPRPGTPDPFQADRDAFQSRHAEETAKSRADFKSLLDAALRRAEAEVDMSPSATMERALKQGVGRGGQGPGGGAGGGGMPEAEDYGYATSEALKATGPVMQSGEAWPTFIPGEFNEPHMSWSYTGGARLSREAEDRIKQEKLMETARKNLQVRDPFNKGGGGQGGGTGGGGMDMVQEAAPGDDARGLTADPKSVLQDYAKLNQAYQGNVTSPAIEENGRAIAEVGAKMAALPPTYKFSRDGIPEGMDTEAEMARLGALIGKNEASANDIDNYITLQVAQKTAEVRNAGKSEEAAPEPASSDPAPNDVEGAKPQPPAAAQAPKASAKSVEGEGAAIRESGSRVARGGGSGNRGANPPAAAPGSRGGGGSSKPKPPVEPPVQPERPAASPTNSGVTTGPVSRQLIGWNPPASQGSGSGGGGITTGPTRPAPSSGIPPATAKRERQMAAARERELRKQNPGMGSSSGMLGDLDWGTRDPNYKAPPRVSHGTGLPVVNGRQYAGPPSTDSLKGPYKAPTPDNRSNTIKTPSGTISVGENQGGGGTDKQRRPIPGTQDKNLSKAKQMAAQARKKKKK